MTMSNKQKKLFKNHFVIWGSTIPIAIASIFIIATITLKTGFFHQEIISDLVAIAFILVSTVVAMNLLIRFMGYRLNKKYTQKFNHYDSTLSYEETKQLLNIIPNTDHIVLLFHGFTASTQEFKYLIPYLDKYKISYYAPKITGFGISNTKILSELEAEDWFRIALESYDLAKQIATNVSIVGHSMGSILATYVAKHRPVNHLILSAPGLYSCKSDLVYKRILLNPYFSLIFRTIIPMLPKPIRKNRASPSDTLDSSVLNSLFQYIAIPIYSVMQVFRAQNLVDIAQTNANKIYVLYGKYDLTVDTEMIFAEMDQKKLVYSKFFYENSAHNLLEDYERDTVCKTITNILLDTDQTIHVKFSPLVKQENTCDCGATNKTRVDCEDT